MTTRTVRAGNTSFTIELRDEADESVANEIFSLHEYRSAEEIIKNATHPVVDIGAHAGFFTLFARGLNAVVPIAAIEPAVENVAQLQRHLGLNKITGVTVLAGAVVGEKRGQKLVMTADNHNHYLSETQDKKTDHRPVKLFNLADIRVSLHAERIALVKCDIEGGEYDIIDVTPEDELQKVNAFILEYHEAGSRTRKILETRLRECGFGVQVFPSKFEKTMGFIYATNKRK